MNHSDEIYLNDSSNLDQLMYTQSYSTATKYVIFTFSAIIGSVSLVSISFLLFIFFKNKSLIKNSVNIFVLNLVFIDLAQAAIHLPIFSYSIELIFVAERINTLIDSFFGKSNIICNLNSFMSTLFETAQVLSFVVISYERFKIVLSPLLNQSNRFKLSKILLSLSWTFSLLITIFYVF
jgi:hypothetical protein